MPTKERSPLSLFKSTMHYGLASTSSQIIGFVLLPLYSRFLTATDYGIMEMATSLGAFLFLCMRLGLTGSVSRFYYDHNEGDELGKYLSTVHRFMLASSFVVGLVAILVLEIWGNILAPGLESLEFKLLIVATAFCSGQADLQRRLVQAREQSLYYAKLTLLNTALTTLAALILVIGFRFGARGMLWAQFISALYMALQAQRYMASDLKLKIFRYALLKDSLVYSIKLLPNQLVQAATPYFSRSLLANLNSLASLGFFSVALRFAYPMGILSNSLTNAYNPIYFANRKKDTLEANRELATLEEMIWYLGICTFVAVATICPPIMLMILPDQFDDSAKLVPFIGLSFLAQIAYVILAPELWYQKRTELVPLLGIFSVLANLAAVAIAVPAYGAVGIAMGTLMGNSVSALTFGIVGARYVKMPRVWSRFASALVLGVVLGFGGNIWHAKNPGVWLAQGFFLLLICAGFFMLRNRSKRAQIRVILEKIWPRKAK